VTPARTARQIAAEVARLRPDWRNPEAYFANRHEIEAALRRLARELEHRTHA
jgi:hypothetical protein